MSAPLEGDARGTLSKREWRRAMVEAIAGLDPSDRRAQEASLAEAFPRLPGWHEARIILLYVSAFPEEVDTGPLLTMAYDAGKRVILPRVDRREHGLRLHRVIDPARAGAGRTGNPRAAPVLARDLRRFRRLGPCPRTCVRRPRLSTGPGRRALRPPPANDAAGRRLLVALPGVSTRPAAARRAARRRPGRGHVPRSDHRRSRALRQPPRAGRLIGGRRPAFPPRHRLEITPAQRAVVAPAERTPKEFGDFRTIEIFLVDTTPRDAYTLYG